MSAALPRAVCLVGALFTWSATTALAQFDPTSGQWGKDEDHHLRVMTWNVKDGLCTSNNKQEGLNNWTALCRSVASFQPDVLLLQECADNSGNGTGSGVDSVAELTAVLELMMHGGSDPDYNGAAVTSYVQAYAPGYDLPYIYVPNKTDNYNRNAVMSRYPLVDLNGDGQSTWKDTPSVSATSYAPGGTGGIRGFQFVEIDLPDGIYSGDLVVGGAHLKAGGGTDDEADRREAAQNVAYVIEHLFNGAGTGTVDPQNKIADSPQVTSLLDANTPVILAGDFNEDESTNGQKGPVEWLTQAEFTGQSDGTDRDGSDMLYDDGRDYAGSDNTIGSKKLDYIAWQDSIATLANEFLFHSNSVPLANMPGPMLGFPNPIAISSYASDHKLVVCDFELPRMIIDPICFGDSQLAVCPCLNSTMGVQGCLNSTGVGGILSYTGTAEIAADDLSLFAYQCRQSQTGVFLQGGALSPQGFRDGVLCIGPPTRRLEFVQTDFLGAATSSISIVTEGNNVPGITRYYQFWFRDPGGPCGFGSNLTSALRVVWQ
jgi:endonuclease/exonuclease/phosphatase family metal-dependent hydrolase